DRGSRLQRLDGGVGEQGRLTGGAGAVPGCMAQHWLRSRWGLSWTGPARLLCVAVAILAAAACTVSDPVSAAGGQPDPGIKPAPTAYRPTPRPVTARPRRVLIPAIGVDAVVEPVGLRPDLSMDVPRVV